MKIKSMVESFYEDYDYYVNDEKKIVVAKCQDVYHKICKNISEAVIQNEHSILRPYLFDAINVVFDKRGNDDVTVKTTCLPSDEYSEEAGIEIARLKLEKKIIHIWNQIIDEAVHAISKDAAELIMQTKRINRIDAAISNKIEQFFSDYSSKAMKK